MNEGQGQAGGTGDIRQSAQQVGQNIRDLGGQVRDVATEQYEQLKNQARTITNRVANAPARSSRTWKAMFRKSRSSRC